ncbi:DNA-directed RNA polymerase subunit delta [Bacillus salacetis]|uniref:Probable DNA-directed RNA polymerase subunit delta n=1 Tax=Bacillus salacetis TaxID=2315464 RepID=A0A3A1R2M1_9BACI|nr:DNA-directed RNA polymerase subunit delta [Bacillus salacetis]RIW36158.1 DNA-directed RNA polymerase subunit delta [Bacillus salacetis]
MSLKQLSTEELHQMSFIELAHELLADKKQAMSFNDLIKQIGDILELSGEEVRSRMVQFYTDLNVDGRFIALGENRWGIRAWYPVDQIEEETVPTIKTRKKKSKKKDDEDLEEDFDDEDLDFDDLDDLDEEDLTDDEEDLDDDDDEEDLDSDEEEIDEELIDEDEYDLGDDEEEEELDEDDEDSEKEDK